MVISRIFLRIYDTDMYHLQCNKKNKPNSKVKYIFQIQSENTMSTRALDRDVVIELREYTVYCEIMKMKL